MKTRIFLVDVVIAVLGLLVGRFVVGLFTHNHTAQYLGALTCAILAPRALRRATVLWVALVVPGAARDLVRVLFRAPEGGRLPHGFPVEARRVDQTLALARVELRRTRPRKRPGLMERERVRVHEVAREATIAGYGDAVLEILLFREPCAGPPDIQAAWVQLLAAARDGVANGEAAIATASPTAR